VPTISRDEALHLSLLESVRCLDCGAVYAKPRDGGTLNQNPGCPDCGYVGWVPADVVSFSELFVRLRRGVGHPRHLFD
jgi:hypothetical protein